VRLPTGAERLDVTAADGAPVHAVWMRAPEGGRTVVFWHGNGEVVAEELSTAADLRARGLGAVLVEYRGYGESSALTPGEQGFYLDAAAVLDALAARGVRGDDVALWGTSLGTGVAAEMAARGRASALVLVSPFTSMSDEAQRVAWFLPARALLPDRFDTLGKASRIGVPTLVIHGDSDELVPYAMGREVAAAIPGARLLTVEGGGHNDLFAREGTRLMDAITAAARAPRGR
jgi:hypothetical protein